mmetsp:Transcript_79588/g.140457  ORF Transcript_79588/g.140457 Transcript_79588/m.140457 type:complete len:252 (-) Transcript_79588:854-1609(-)
MQRSFSKGPACVDHVSRRLCYRQAIAPHQRPLVLIFSLEPRLLFVIPRSSILTASSMRTMMKMMNRTLRTSALSQACSVASRRPHRSAATPTGRKPAHARATTTGGGRARRRASGATWIAAHQQGPSGRHRSQSPRLRPPNPLGPRAEVWFLTSKSCPMGPRFSSCLVGPRLSSRLVGPCVQALEGSLSDLHPRAPWGSGTARPMTRVRMGPWRATRPAGSACNKGWPVYWCQWPSERWPVTRSGLMHDPW